ncbi:MAG: hypothetical protein H7841_04310 [Magnetospirillum sp. WYHS-4]
MIQPDLDVLAQALHLVAPHFIRLDEQEQSFPHNSTIRHDLVALAIKPNDLLAALMFFIAY